MLADDYPIASTLKEAAGRLERLDDMRGWTRRHYVTN